MIIGINKTPLYLAIIATTSASVSLAQDQPGHDKPSFAIEEVVVTARKRSESLQEVPLAVTPFSGEQIDKQGFVNLEDIASNTVGLSYAGGSTSGYQESPTVRGLKQGFLQDRTQNVATFLDGIYLQRQSMANVGLVDMERIEVVKGPQNSLYGRNAFAGAINYVTQKPTEEFEGYFSTTRGDNNREDYRLTLSGPLWKDKLLGRYSYGSSEYDGHTKNKHPFAYADPEGFSDGGSDEMLGGNDDHTYNMALTFHATDNLRLEASYFKTKLKREGQPQYTLNGVVEVAKQQNTPFSDANANEVKVSTQVRDTAGFDLISVGNTIWKGRLPTNPGPGKWVGSIDSTTGQYDFDWGYGDGVIAEDQRIAGAVDPRNVGFTANSEILRLGLSWDISDDWSTKYVYGGIEHEGTTGGPADRDPLFGSNYVDVTNVGLEDFRVDQYIQTNGISERPNIDQESTSHELRFDWHGNDKFAASFGSYYSKVEDEEYSRTLFAPICTTDDQLIDQDQNPNIGCFLNANSALTATPLNQAVNTGFYIFARDQWNGASAPQTAYEDTISSFFAMFEYHVTSEFTIRIEGRYTEEEKTIERMADLWGLKAGESATGDGGFSDVTFESVICDANESEDCIPSKQEKTYYYFTPKVGVEWSVTDDNFLYAYAAKGLKAGGFNNTSVMSQSTFDEETNWTFELGSKNTFFEGVLQVNAAVYYVDWSDVQGAESPATHDNSPNANVVTGNIGDVHNLGFEVDGLWAINENFTLNFGAAYTNPKYDDDVEYDAAQRYFYYQCTPENLQTDTNVNGASIGGNFDDIIDPGELCGNTDVGGNELPKVSKYQYLLGLNFNTMLFDGWDFNARIDGNYQSKQWINALNEGFIPSRTLWNASASLMAPEHWEFSVWGKNIFDKEYIGGAFQLELFNKYIVSYGAGATYGATVKYNF